MKTELYPLKFHPIFKDKIWGGHKIKNVLGKDFSPLPNCGETWEVSGVAGNVSKVAEGPLAGQDINNLISTYGTALLGESGQRAAGGEFPLLFKFIDANADLSIQVHPDDALATERHQSLGKTEMWYILQADEDAELISGFNQPMNKESYLTHLKSNTLDEILNREAAKAGDVFFIPAGRVHTIGKGLLLAEIQQSSDVTYRIYDFDRTDAQGNRRELHTEQALNAIDFNYYPSYRSPYAHKADQATTLAACPYFTVNKLSSEKSMSRNYQDLASFVVYICLSGSCRLSTASAGTTHLKQGECVLIPAEIKEVDISTDLGSNKPGAELLEVYIPNPEEITEEV